MTRPKAREKLQTVTVRLPSTTVREVDALGPKLAVPGFRPCRTDVMRMALTRGIAVLEEELAVSERAVHRGD